MRISKKWKLYELIDKHEGLMICELCAITKWKPRKVIRIVRRLYSDGIIRGIDDNACSILHIKWIGVPFQELINWDEVKRDYAERVKDTTDAR